MSFVIFILNRWFLQVMKTQCDEKICILWIVPLIWVEKSLMWGLWRFISFFTKSIKRLPTSDAYYVTIIVIAGVKRYLISHELSSTTMNILINLIRWNRMPARPATAAWFSYHWMMFTAADRTFKNTPLIFKVLIWCSSLAILVNFLIYMGSMKPAFHWNMEITIHDKKGKFSYKNNIFVEMYVIFWNIKQICVLHNNIL